MNWCILIPLITGLICAFFGYLLGRLVAGSKISAIEKEWKAKCHSLEKDLHYSNDKLSAANIEIKAMSALSKMKKTSPKKTSDKTKTIKTPKKVAPKTSKQPIPFDAALAKSIFGKSIKKDDLKIIEGIGPKIARLFHDHNIKTWKALSECSIKKCQEVLDSTGGSDYNMANPGTWPKQAKLAYEGKWKQLLSLQAKLDGGVK